MLCVGGIFTGLHPLFFVWWYSKETGHASSVHFRVSMPLAEEASLSGNWTHVPYGYEQSGISLTNW